MDSNTTLLDLIRAEQERRKAQAPSHVVLFRWNNKTDAEWDEEIAAKRRSGEIGPNTVVIPYVWDGPPWPKKLV